MTVAGRGGRPRKWRSDADRVRAFRARQRGETEPPQVDAVVDESDELAVAWRRVDELGRRLDEERRTARALRTELRQLRNQLDAEGARFGWLQTANDELRRSLSDSEAQCEALDQELAAIRQAEAARQATPPPTADDAERGGSVSRAQRRRLAREPQRGRRRGDR